MVDNSQAARYPASKVGRPGLRTEPRRCRKDTRLDSAANQPDRNRALAQIALDGARINAVIRQFVAVTMPQHVRVDLHIKARRAGRTLHHGLKPRIKNGVPRSLTNTKSDLDRCSRCSRRRARSSRPVSGCVAGVPCSTLGTAGPLKRIRLDTIGDQQVRPRESRVGTPAGSSWRVRGHPANLSSLGELSGAVVAVRRAVNVVSPSATRVTVCFLQFALLSRTFPHHSRGPLPGQCEPPP